jgi:predicted LPLAT superfamily acyltransferase
MARRFEVQVSGLDALHAQLDRGRGLLLFGSHLGSFDVLRVLARKRPEYTIRVVLDKAHNPAVTQLLDALNPEVAATVIDAGQDGPALMLAIQQAVQEGALVALLVDRAHPGGGTVAAPFFGAPAAFPTAPWLIALALKAPVVLGFGLYRGGRRYELRFEHFCDPLEIPRGQRQAAIAQLVQRYVARLEAVARSAPYNWFNFYNVWDDADGVSHAHTDPARPDAQRRLDPASAGSLDAAPAPDAAVGVGAGADRDDGHDRRRA